MPEGDTLFRTATTLRKALLDKSVTRFDTRMPAVADLDARRPVARRIVQAVESRGKHLLIVFRKQDSPAGEACIRTPERLKLPLLQDDLVLHTHLRMTGSWHIYREGEPWRKPTEYMRVAIVTDEFVAPCFSAPVVELLTARETARHPDLSSLGPDAITPEFDIVDAKARLRRCGDLPVGVALMDQRAMAGVGNVFKSEVLFIRRVSPFVKVSALRDDALDGLIEESHKLLRLNTERGLRRTLFHLDERKRLWVYGRSGEPCRVCGETIRMRRQGLDGRSTYYCPACQGTDVG